MVLDRIFVPVPARLDDARRGLALHAHRPARRVRRVRAQRGDPAVDDGGGAHQACAPVAGAVALPESAASDSFESHILDAAYYTRPELFRGLTVPPVLLSGDHEKVRLWRRRDALRRTRARRPELLAAAALSAEDREILQELERGETWD